MDLIKGAPYLISPSNKIVYITEVVDGEIVKVLYRDNGVQEAKSSKLIPLFEQPQYKYRFDDLFVDVSVPMQIPGGETVSWDEWIQSVWNPHCRAKKIYDMPLYGVYKGILFDVDSLKSKVMDYYNLKNGKI